jgi:3D (Asp-Asp-Asp) domain-containing protein
MQSHAARFTLLALCLFAAACSSTRPLPKYEKPLARAGVRCVRTTAYTHTEGDHLQYSNRNACGDQLQYGSLRSAACDWSRWPVGTVFRIQQTGETYVVDDYGWALSGTNTIDLYKPSRSAMNDWGVRRVNIELVQWGDVRRSLAILEPRAKHAHVRRMVNQIRSRYAELSKPLPSASSTEVAMETSRPVERALAVEPMPVARAVAAASPVTQGGFIPPSQTQSQRPPLTPFSVGAVR